MRRFYGDLAVEISFSANPRRKANPQAEQLRRKVELIKRSFQGKLIS